MRYMYYLICLILRQVVDSNGSSTLLAADSEEEMTTWMQSLCMAASGVEVSEADDEWDLQ